ncbi:MAG: DUF2834 domain-containing protein [Leptolyngbyaceae bacterium]|nr:DUF2834 domain-containing protein [Leptolyngbyaceae bacterium]
MVTKILLGTIWVAFVSYTLWLAPIDQSDSLPVVQKLITGQWSDLNPYLVSLFNLMGVWPMIYACLIFVDGKTQKIPAWPFWIASNGAGALALLPYLILRKPNQEVPEVKNWLLKSLDSRWTGIVLSITTIGLLAYALLLGDWGDYVRQCQTQSFPYLMSLDFCTLTLVFPSLLGDDMARRGWNNPRLFWAFALVPLLGPLAYLCFRPSLVSSEGKDSPVVALSSN